LTEEQLDWLSGREPWKDLKSIILYRRKCVEGDKMTVSTHYYINSLALDVEEAARAIRGHWSIENNLHWYLDVCFGEDAGRAGRNHAAENLNTLRKIALYLLRKEEPPEKCSLKRKMLKAATNVDFLSKLLFDSA
jgi:predicted transposase YbfD/YdcC